MYGDGLPTCEYRTYRSDELRATSRHAIPVSAAIPGVYVN